MTHAAKPKLCDKPAFERPKQPRGRVRWITFEEADRLIASCAPHLVPLVTFMLFTGCRIGEALALASKIGGASTPDTTVAPTPTCRQSA
jgi:integrase